LPTGGADTSGASMGGRGSGGFGADESSTTVEAG
jgi:hypothetical protein